MTQLPPDPNFRVYYSGPRRFRWIGCAGCLVGLFVLGGILGILLLGWRALLGY